MDDIPVKEMVLPLVVIDVSKKVEQNPDYQITMGDVTGVGGKTWGNPGKLVCRHEDRLVKEVAESRKDAQRR